MAVNWHLKKQTKPLAVDIPIAIEQPPEPVKKTGRKGVIHEPEKETGISQEPTGDSANGD